MTADVRQTIVLFTFYDHFELCKSRIGLLRRFNPGLRIYGVYGGEPAGLTSARALEQYGVAHVHDASGHPALWNWKNTDLVVADWFREAGRCINFERVHVVDWDLLLFADVGRLYANVPNGAVGLTGLTPLREVADRWTWTADEPYSVDSAALLEAVRDRYGYLEEPYASMGPGYSLPRGFLDAYSGLQPTETGHDELRLPLFAQILGFELADTGFYPRWMDPAVEVGFNADAIEVDPALVWSELARCQGRRVFHPCRDQFHARAIDAILAAMEQPPA